MASSERPHPPENHEAFNMIRILQDCRDESEYGPDGNLTGDEGVYLGDYQTPNEEVWTNEISLRVFLTEEPQQSDDANPLLGVLGASGTMNFIWGMQCWWVPITNDNAHPTSEQLAETQMRLAQHIQSLNDRLSRPEDN